MDNPHPDPVTPTNCIHVAKCKTFAFDDIHIDKIICSVHLLLQVSSLLVLNNNNERVCGIRQEKTSPNIKFSL